MLKRKGFTLVEILVVIAVICIVVAIAVPVIVTQENKTDKNTNASTPNSGEVELNKPESTDLENTLSDIPRKDAEDIIKNFQHSTANMSVHYYKNGKALKKIIALQSEIAGDDNPIEKWSDKALQTRAKIVRAYFPQMEIRQDKLHLKNALDDMIAKDIPNDSRYNAEDITTYNGIIERANSMLNNLDANESNVNALKDEINSFMTKYM